MDIKSTIGDTNLRTNGVEVQFQDDSFVTVCYSGNDDFRNFLARQMTVARRSRRNATTLPPEVVNEITIAATAKFLIKGWRGFTDKGAPFEFTEKNAILFLTQSADFRDFIAEQSGDLSLFGGGEEAKGAKEDLKSRPPVGSTVGTRA